MTPPQLPADAPVADVLQPMEVHLGVHLGDDSGVPLSHGLQRRLRQRFGLDEPLGRQLGLDDRGAALAAPDGQHMVLIAAVQTGVGQGAEHGVAGRPSIEAGELPVPLDHPGLVVEDGDHGQVVAFARLEVVEVVGGGHLDGAGAELRVHQDVVPHDEDLSVDEGVT